MSFSNRNIRPIVPGGPIYADDENAKAEEIKRLSNLTVDGADVYSGPTGNHVSYRRKKDGFWAKITSGDNPYAWIEQEPGASGTFADKTSGRTGTITENQAYERNGNATVQLDSIIWLSPVHTTVSGTTANQEYSFDASPSASGADGEDAYRDRFCQIGAYQPWLTAVVDAINTTAELTIFSPLQFYDGEIPLVSDFGTDELDYADSMGASLRVRVFSQAVLAFGDALTVKVKFGSTIILQGAMTSAQAISGTMGLEAHISSTNIDAGGETTDLAGSGSVTFSGAVSGSPTFTDPVILPLAGSQMGSQTLDWTDALVITVTATGAGILLDNLHIECTFVRPPKACLPTMTNGQLLIGYTGTRPVATLPTDTPRIQWVGGAGTLAMHNYLTRDNTVAAAGTTQGTATELDLDTSSVFRVNSATGGSAEGIKLKTTTKVLQGMVYNDTAVALKIYPQTGSFINLGTINVHVGIPANSAVWFYYSPIAVSWYVQALVLAT